MSSSETPTSSEYVKSESVSKKIIEYYFRNASDRDIKKYMRLRLHSINGITSDEDLESDELILAIQKFDQNSASNERDKENWSREANNSSSVPRTALLEFGSLERLVLKDLFKPPSVSKITDQLSDEIHQTPCPCPCLPQSTESRREKWRHILESFAKKYSSRSVNVRTHKFIEIPKSTPKVIPNSNKFCQTTTSKPQTQSRRNINHSCQTSFDTTEGQCFQEIPNDPNHRSTTDPLIKRPATEVDLGIKLLCSLIDAKNLTKTQKIQLGKKIFEKITKQRSPECSQSGDGSALNSSIVSSAISTHSPIENVSQSLIEIMQLSKDPKEQTQIDNSHASGSKSLNQEMIEEQIQTEELSTQDVEEAEKTPPSKEEPVTMRENLSQNKDRKEETQNDNSHASRSKRLVQEMSDVQTQTEELPTRDVEEEAKTSTKSSPSPDEPATIKESLPQSIDKKEQTQNDNSHVSRSKRLVQMSDVQTQTEELPTTDVEEEAKTPIKSSPSPEEPTTIKESLPQSIDKKEQTQNDNSHASRSKRLVQEMRDGQTQTEELPTTDVEEVVNTPTKSSPSLEEPVTIRETLTQSKDQKEQTQNDNSHVSQSKALVQEMRDGQTQTEELSTMDVNEVVNTSTKSSPSLEEPITIRESLPQSKDQKEQTQNDNSHVSRSKKEMRDGQTQTEELPTKDVEKVAKTPTKSSTSREEPVTTRESLRQSKDRKKRIQIDKSHTSRSKSFIPEMSERQTQTEKQPTKDVKKAAKSPTKWSPSPEERITTRESLRKCKDWKKPTQINNCHASRCKSLIQEMSEGQTQTKKISNKNVEKSAKTPSKPSPSLDCQNLLKQSEKNYDKKSKSFKSQTCPSPPIEHYSKRSRQLNKIDREIGRLEGLKTLLLQEPSKGHSRSLSVTSISSRYKMQTNYGETCKDLHEEQKDLYNNILCEPSNNFVICNEPTRDKKHCDCDKVQYKTINDEYKPSSSYSTSRKKNHRSEDSTWCSHCSL